MNRHLYGIVAVIIVVGLSFSCYSPKKTDDIVKVTDSQEVTNTVKNQDESGSVANGKSLNDIRFANFTDKDWLDNEYIRTLRKYIDLFNKGEIEDEELKPYKDKVQGKFVIANVESFLLGGLFFQIVFIDQPENVFTAWVYSDVDEDAETVIGYSVRRISLDERKNELSKEEILQEMKEHPELKLW